MHADDIALIRTFLERYGVGERRPRRLDATIAWGLVRLHRDDDHRLYVSLGWGLVSFTLEREYGAQLTAPLSLGARWTQSEKEPETASITAIGNVGPKLRGTIGQAS